MANYATLKAAIQDVIKTNGNNEITGQILQNSLVAMINSLGGHYQYAGTATPSTNPGKPDQNVFYLASTAGTYSNFGGIVLGDGEIAILKYNGSWAKDSTGAASLEKVNNLQKNVGVLNVNLLNSHPSAYATKEDARGAVPELLRTNGLIITYLLGSAWITEKFGGTTITATTWLDSANERWVSVTDGYVDGIVNVNALNRVDTAYQSAGAARLAVPFKLRKFGLIISYLLADGWHYEFFAGQTTTTTAWRDNNNENWHKLMSKDDVEQIIVKFGNRVDEIENVLKNAVYALFEKGSVIPYSQTENGLIDYTGTVIDVSGYVTRKYVIGANKFVFVSGRSAAGNYCLAVAFDASGNVLKYYEKTKRTTYDKFLIITPENTSYIKVSGTERGTNIVGAYYIDWVSIIRDAIPQTAITESETHDGSTNNRVATGGGFDSGGSYVSKKFSVLGMRTVAISGYCPSSNALCVVNVYDDSDQFICSLFAGNNGIIESKAITLPENASYIWVMGHPSYVLPAAYTTTISKSFYTKTEIDQRINSYWAGKKLWWCGTSIPAGSDETLGLDQGAAGDYPSKCGVILGASVYNRAVGGSMCRANVRTGNYAGANFQNITSALTMTNAEAEDFITNYDTYRALPGNSGWPASLTDAYKTRLRAASFENRLLPYLNGTLPMADLWVIDHGHNDFKYKLPDNSTDIGLEPTRANITAGILAEDTYMTANNYANLISFFGSLSNIDPAKLDAFVCGLNRNCFIGAVNFIMTLILRYNPRARFVFVSNYEYEHGDYPTYAPLILAQEAIANSWAFPLCRVYEKLGFSNHIIPGTKNYYAGQSTPYTYDYDIDVFKINCPDLVHPASDLSGHSTDVYAGILAEFINGCR